MRFPRSTSSLLLAFPLLMAGCNYEQSKPPTAEGLVLIKARTAVGTHTTKLEARPMTNPPKAGEISIWALKVFDIKDKPNGERNEWKFFNQLPQTQNGEEAGTTDVLMRAWIISKDKSVFLSQSPSYKAYGSFVTDWIIPKAGDYSVFVEYQPAASGNKIYDVEMARWDFKTVPNDNGSAQTVSVETPVVKPAENAVVKGDQTLREFGSASEKGIQGPAIVFSSRKNPKSGDYENLEVKPKDKSALSNQEVAALSPDGKTLLNFVGERGQLVFPQKGNWDLWITFQKDGEKFTSRGIMKIS